MMTLSKLVRRTVPVLLLVAFLLAGLAARGFMTRAERAALPDAANGAIQSLASSSALDRANAVKTLRVLNEPAAVPALLDHLDDPDQAVGLSIAQALGDLATPDQLPALRTALRSANPDVRWRAAYALGQRRDARSVEDLAALLRDPDVLVQRNAGDALAKIGDPAAGEALAGSLGSPQASVTMVAMSSLEAMGKPAVPALTGALDSNNALMRENAATVLGYIASPLGKPALQLALVDPVPTVRSEAQWALAEIDRGSQDR
jgi:HEAT repeat protein